MSVVIEADGFGVRFRSDRLGRPVTPALARLRRRGSDHWALRDCTVRVRGGESVALIGPSGAGKTTLLRSIAGVYEAAEGSLAVRGRVASLLAIDAGLLSPLSGRENAELLGVLGGLSRRDSLAQLDAVRERSGLGDSFELPVATHSQGMRARLGFAVADRDDLEVLVLDEVHEAFDHEFRGVLERRALEILGAGGTLVAAGHDHPMLARLCSRAILLDRGRIVDDGEFEEVRRAYLG